MTNSDRIAFPFRNPQSEIRNSHVCSRRHFVDASSFSLAGLALSTILRDDGLLAGEPSRPELEPTKFDLLPKQPHFAAKAKAMISIFMVGGPSQIDLFDPKPKLVELNGKDYPGDLKYDNSAQASRKILGPIAKFKHYGKCGMEMSELLPNLGSVADDLLLIRSMHTGVNNHGQSLFALNNGSQLPGRPALGSWMTYALGSQTRELPAFVALTHPSGLPLLAQDNWSSAALPSIYQGTVARPREPRILNLDPPAHLKGKPQAAQLELLRQLNARHLDAHPGEQDLAARIASYELAGKMQLAAREAFDISRESPAVRKMYGWDEKPTADYGARCLIARRLVERGVRFVQIWNNGQSWDHHGNIITALPQRCKEIDQPVAALIRDLKERGLFDSTVVHWGGEMGRLPVIQTPPEAKSVGRDHNTYGFSMLVAGGGFKRGHVHGATDEFSYRAVTDIVNHYDWHATLLQQFGLDHRRLLFKRAGRELSLIANQPAKVIRELLA